MRLQVHIGTYKTGTTSIQVALSQAADVLEDRAIRYSQVGLNPKFQKHLHLFDHLVDDGTNTPRHAKHRRTRLAAQLRSELIDPNTQMVVLSEEELSYPSSVIPEFFGQFQDLANIEVVMVVRDQPDFLESLYLQWLKEGPRGITGTFEQMCEDSSFLARGDFSVILDRWSDVLGTGAITVLDFDQLRKGDLVENFCEAVGLPPLLTPDSTTNPTISPAGGELLRRAGRADPDFRRMQFFINRLEPTDIGRTSSVCSSAVRANLLSHFEASNKRLRVEYGVTLNTSQSKRMPLQTSAELHEQALDLSAEALASLWLDFTAQQAKVRRLRRQLRALDSQPADEQPQDTSTAPVTSFDA